MKPNSIGNNQYINFEKTFNKPHNIQKNQNEQFSALSKVSLPEFVQDKKYENFFSDIVKISNYMNVQENDKEAVLICGDTGSGKSTLVNYLAGIPGIIKQQKHSNNFIIEFAKPIATVSDKCGSETEIPGRYKVKDFTVWDCPGFEDTRGELVDITNAFSISSISNHVKNVKVLAVVEEGALNSGRGKFIRNLVNKVMRMLPDEKNLSDSVVFCFTKVKDIKDYKKELIKIAGDNNDLAEDHRVFLKEIANKEQFITFPKPTKEGYIDNNVKELLVHKLTKSISTNSELLPVISMEGIEHIDGIVSYVNKKALFTFENIAKEIMSCLINNSNETLEGFTIDFLNNIFPLNDDDTDLQVLNKLENIVNKYKLNSKCISENLEHLKFLSEKIMLGIANQFLANSDSFDFDTLEKPLGNLLYEIKDLADKKGIKGLSKEIDFRFSKNEHRINIKA